MKNKLTTYSIYFAGDLFDHKHLIGNKLLASAIEEVSRFKYKCILPQEHEQADHRATAIRNQDIYLLANSDFAVFNFDGTDLDSGTVVEFVIAKMLNIPSVILRTDFRAAGDQLKDGDPWNLMASGYPNTQKVLLNGMGIYKQHQPNKNIVEEIYNTYAEFVVEELNRLLETGEYWGESISKTLYHQLNSMMGSNFNLTAEEIFDIIETKSKKGLIIKGS